MRKFWLVLFLVPLGSTAYCSLPLTSVAVLTELCLIMGDGT